MIGIFKKQYKASHLAWFYVTKTWPDPDMVIDHINGDKLDDRFCNLRQITRRENGQNRAGTRDKASGLPIGVFPNARASRAKKFPGRWPNHTKPYMAEIGHNGQRIRLGAWETVEEAFAAYTGASLALRRHISRANTTLGMSDD